MMQRTRIFLFSKGLLSGLLTAVVISAFMNPASANARRTPVVEAVEKVLPSVANISTTKNVRINRSPFRTPFPDFFFPFDEAFSQTYQLEGLGSGVIVEGGYVITNFHVISYEYGPADKIVVTHYKNKEQYEAEIVGADPKADVAILKIKGEAPSTYLPWGRSDDLMIGETVIGIGSSLGQPFTVTQGIISALERTIEDKDSNRLYNLIQTDADINQGNSGGPLVNINGEFIGLNTAILSPSGGSVGIGFAIPVSRVKKIYDYWVKDIFSIEDRMGIEIQEMDARIENFFRTNYASLKTISLNGVVVLDVAQDGLCHTKLKRADIIHKVDGFDIENVNDLRSRLEEHTGTSLQLGIIQEGTQKTVTIPIPATKVEKIQWLGMEIQEIDPAWRRWYDLSDNAKYLVIKSVKLDSLAHKAGLQRGYIIAAINQQEISTLADLQKVRKQISRNESILFTIYRKESKQFRAYSATIQSPGFF
jgi:serine protease Do